MRLCAYLWIKLGHTINARDKKRVLKRADGSSYTSIWNFYTCIFLDNYSCNHCNKEPTLLDFKILDHNSYSPGEKIIGDIQRYSQAGCHYMCLSKETHQSLTDVSSVRNWHTIKPKKECAMKYNVNFLETGRSCYQL